MSDKSLFAQPLSVYEERNMKFVEALRSGKYQQGYDHLATVEANGTSYCCLGVASVLHGKSEQAMVMAPCLFAETRDWYGWSSAYGYTHSGEKIIIDDESFMSLSRANDSKKASFEQIADWLEKNWQLMLNPQAVKDM